MDDAKLLADYVGSQSESAFRELVERHMSLVYYAALRQVGNASLAEDVAQVVFILLARKASRLGGRTSVAGWLYNTTRFAAAKAVRAEARRMRREQISAETVPNSCSKDWAELEPLLDHAMRQLNEPDRTAILLRYFENKSLSAVGEQLGVSEDTAQKRVARAVEKLRQRLLRRGLATSAAATAALVSAHAAPPGTPLSSASIAAVSLGHQAGSPLVVATVQRTLRRFFWPKAMAVIGGLALLATAIPLKGPRQQSPPASVFLNVKVDAPGNSTIRFNLLGTPGLRFQMVCSDRGGQRTYDGVVPGEVSFQAEAFTATIGGIGGGDLGLEIYRDNLQVANRAVGSLNPAQLIFIQGMPGGQGIRMSAKPTNAFR